MRWLSRVMYWLRFRVHQRELEEELASHRTMLADDLERRGMPAAVSRDAAARTMGNETYMREEARAVWLPVQLETLMQDLRYAWRGLVRSPGFTLVATLSLAIGIGANTAIFSLIDGLLLARVPVPAAKQLIEPVRVVGKFGIDQRFSRAEFDALASGPIPLTMLSSTNAAFDADGLTATISVDVVDGRYFDLLGIGAERGRVLSTLDDASAGPVVVITDEFWRSRLNGDPAVLGRVVKLNGQPFTIVGITPPRFAGVRFPAIANAMIPLRTALALNIVREPGTGAPIVAILGRRPAAWSLDATQAALAAAWKRCCADGQHIRQGRGQVMAPAAMSVVDVSRGIPTLKVDLRGRYTRILMALMGGVAILLVAACVNVGSLLLARGSARAHELAVRVAIGASRLRILRQLLIESLELALLGAVGGVLLAWWGTTVLARAHIGDLAAIAPPAPSGAVLAFTAIVSMLSGLAFGVVPASRVVRGNLVSPIQQSGRRTSRAGSGALDRGLIALQIALALLLVTGAALFSRTLHNLRDTSLGFDPARRLVFNVETRRTAYERDGMTARLTGEMLRSIRALPGVRAAGFASFAPIFGGRSAADNVAVPGAETPPGGDPATEFTGVTPDYFAALGIPLLQGTDISPPVAASPGIPVQRDVVVNQAFARKFFAGRAALGQVFRDADEGDSTSTADRIIGIVGDAKFSSPRQDARPMYFVPVRDHDWPYLVLVVHTARDDLQLGQSVDRIVKSIAPGITVNGPTPLEDAIDDSLIRERLAATLGTLFGAIALALVAVGLYGVMLYQVTQRTREIGIRMALGASGRSVLGMVIGQSLWITTVGVVVGVPLALVASRAVASQLYGVGPYDALAMLAAVAALVAVAIAASLVPARRAVRIDPLEAIRAD